MEFVRIHRTKIIISFLILASLFLYWAGSRQPSIDEPAEGSDADYSTMSNVQNGEDLVQQLGSLEAYDALSQDLHTFGKTAFPAYSEDEQKVVGFEVTSKINKDRERVSFEGKYGSTKNTIRVQVTLLKNFRITSSITDTKTKLNIDSQLPSNSKTNQYVGSLPLQTNSYAIDFSTSDEYFALTIYDGTAATEAAAKKALQDGTGVTDLSTINYRVIIPSSGGEGEGSPAG